MLDQRGLGPLGFHPGGVDLRRGEQHGQSRGRADDDRVDEDAEGLDESLGDGVGDIGGGGAVGRGALAGLVGEQAALGAVQEGGEEAARRAGQARLEVEGAGHDVDKHPGHPRRRDDDDHEDDAEIGHRHERHEPFGHPGDHTHAGEQDRSGDGHQGDRRHRRPDAVALLEGQGDGVGLDHGEDQAEGEDQHGGEDDAHDPAEPTEAAAAPQAQAALHVIGGAAAEDAIGAAHLEDLGERRLREGGRHAEQGHHPHPEQGPGAAQGHRERDPRDIAGSHASSQPDDEGLEARQAAALVARARNQMNRPGEQAHLDAARADRQVQAGAEQDPDEDLPGDELLECGQALREVGSCQNGQRSGHEGLHRSGVGRARQYRTPSPTARGVRQACSCSRRGAVPFPGGAGRPHPGAPGIPGLPGIRSRTLI